MDTFNPPPPRRGGLVVAGVIMAVLGGMCLVAVPIIGILAAIAIPNFVAMQMKSKRAEVPGNVDGLKTAELAYDAAFDAFIPCGTRGGSEAALTKEPHDWSDDPGAKCFETLGWRPDGKLRGSYWTTLENGGTDFTVHGVIDADGDGEVAEYRATLTRNAEMVTWTSVY